jgi:hypothetical protein
MALSQADFYAYSRATGAPVPRDPEEQAQMAPEVLQFRRNQLKSPETQEEQGFGLPQALGVGAALAGVGAAGFGISRLLRQKPAAAAKGSVIRPATVDIESPLKRVITGVQTTSAAAPEVPPSRIPDPWGATTTPPRQAAQGFSPRQYAESTGSLAQLPEGQATQLPTRANQPGSFSDLTAIQDQLLNQNRDQNMNAVLSAEDQQTGRVLRRQQQDTDFIKFSQRADDIAAKSQAIRNLVQQTFSFEEQLENIGLQNKQYQGVPRRSSQFTAQDLTGMFPIGRFNREVRVHEGGRRIGMTESEIRDRVMAAASASPEDAQRLLNPSIPTSDVRDLLGTTPQVRGGRVSVNPTQEIRGGALASMSGISDDIEVPFDKGQLYAKSEQLQKAGASKDVTTGNVWQPVDAEDVVAQRFLSDYNDYLGMGGTAADYGDIEGVGNLLIETKGYKERTNKGTTFVPGRVQDFEAEAPGSLRQEREIDEIIPTRTTATGEQSTGVITREPQEFLEQQTQKLRQSLEQGEIDQTEFVQGLEQIGKQAEELENRPYLLQTGGHKEDVNIEGSRLPGNYETAETIKYFKFGPDPSGRFEIVPEFTDRGRMVPALRPITRGGMTGLPAQKLYGLEQATNMIQPTGQFTVQSDLVDIQPYMMNRVVTSKSQVRTPEGKMVTQAGPQFEVKAPLYGTLLQRKEGKLVPATINRTEASQVIETAQNTWRSLSNEKRLNWLATTDPDRVRDAGYFIAKGPGNVTFVRSATLEAKRPDELFEIFDETAYAADALDKYLKQNRQVDLPVLKDPSAKHYFVKDLARTTVEAPVYGRLLDPTTGRVDYDQPAVPVPGVTQRRGLGGLEAMQLEDAGDINEAVAFFSPRAGLNAPQVVRDRRTGQILTASSSAQSPTGLLSTGEISPQLRATPRYQFVYYPNVATRTVKLPGGEGTYVATEFLPSVLYETKVDPETGNRYLTNNIISQEKTVSLPYKAPNQSTSASLGVTGQEFVNLRREMETQPVGYRVGSVGSFARTQNPYTGHAAAAMGPASRVNESTYQYPTGQLHLGKLPPISQTQLQERNRFALAANLTPGGRVRTGALNLGGGMGVISAGLESLPSESATVARYGMTGSQLQEFGNKLMARAAYKRGMQPGPTRVSAIL